MSSPPERDHTARYKRVEHMYNVHVSMNAPSILAGQESGREFRRAEGNLGEGGRNFRKGSLEEGKREILEREREL